MKVRRLTKSGQRDYLNWLNSRKIGEIPPSELINGDEETETVFSFEIDKEKIFSTRYEFGEYIAGIFSSIDHKQLLSHENDSLWDWLTIVYFKQFGRKVSKPWHYSVTRNGHSGSLAYRHLARTSFEMFWRHRESSKLMLDVDMSTWGDMSEQLTSRQNVAYHRGYIKAANILYMKEGKVRRGSASRTKPKSKRKPGETTGKGGVARLALAVRRLCRTYDTHIIPENELIELLPKEFDIWS